MYRNNAYNELLAREFENIDFAREYILGLVHDEDEPMSVVDDLRFTIPRIGVREFCDLTGKSKSDINKFLNGERNPKTETLNDYLLPFGLKVRIDLEAA